MCFICKDITKRKYEITNLEQQSQFLLYFSSVSVLDLLEPMLLVFRENFTVILLFDLKSFPGPYHIPVIIGTLILGLKCTVVPNRFNSGERPNRVG
jgi:hypothetical protein